MNLGELDPHTEEESEDDEETYNSLEDRYTPTRTRGSGAESEEEELYGAEQPRQKLAVPPEKPPRKS